MGSKCGEEAAVAYIETTDALRAWVARFRDEPELGIDTEGDSMHHYRERVCLIQLTAGGEDAIVDPLVMDDMSPLADWLADPSTIKIFHDACYDLIGLRRDFGFEVAGIFDTMLSCRFLGYSRFGLASQLLMRFDYEADKRFQRSDWTQRPLSAQQLDYARHDTHFLPRFRAELAAELEEAGRLAWATEDFARLPAQTAEMASRSPTDNLERGFWRVRGVKVLSPEEKGRVRALYNLRDSIARERDRPPFRVMSDIAMVSLAQNPPEVVSDIRPGRGIGRTLVNRDGEAIVEACATAVPETGKPPAGVGRRRTGRPSDPDLRVRFDKLRDLRKKVAAHVGVDPEVLLGNAPLDAVIRHPPTSLEGLEEMVDFGTWRRPFLLEPMFETIRSFK